jgi:hypothetical protein
MLATGRAGADGPAFVAVPPSIAEDEGGGSGEGGEGGEGGSAPAPDAAAGAPDALPARRVTKSPDAEAAIAAAMDSCFLFAGERGFF